MAIPFKTPAREADSPDMEELCQLLENEPGLTLAMNEIAKTLLVLVRSRINGSLTVHLHEGHVGALEARRVWRLKKAPKDK